MGDKTIFVDPVTLHIHKISAAAYLNISSQLCTFDKSTKIGTHVDFHLIKNFGYGGTLKYPHGGHSNRLKMAALKFHYFSLKRHLSTSLFHNSS